ncbi:MAG: tetratricopeptide repeat protein [Bacteroidota bacterium]
MPSIIPGYEYDIFISYRQKDNRADHWVTHFVEALKDEIEATFKEDISIYFDENPHDGLLETHDVDLSLSKKLKCLIFIPILSQTYCDPKSFAWQHELQPFLDLVKNDKIGLDITLPNGNVCKRILPVRIHELEKCDKQLFEKEIDGALRSIDFIYRTTGVNRPLSAEEENPHDNLNKTFYRDQINKIANAIKEVIGGVRGDKTVVEVKEVTKSTKEPSSTLGNMVNMRTKVILTSVFLVVVLGMAYLFYGRSASVNDGIAVLTFSDFSVEESNQYLAAGISEAIRINLGQASHLKVISRNSIEKFEKLGLSTPEIASKLGVKYVLDGSVQKEKNNIRINIELIEAKEDAQLWVEVYNKPYNDLLGMQNNIATDIAQKLNIATNDESKSYPSLKNPKAYDLYLKGMALVKRPTGLRDYLEETLSIFDSVIVFEPSFAPAYVAKAQAYINDMYYARSNIRDIKGTTIDLIMKAMELDNDISECYSILGIIYFHDLDFSKAEEYLLKAIELNPNNVEAYRWLATLKLIMGDIESGNAYSIKAIELDPLNIRLQVDNAVNSGWGKENWDDEIEKLEKLSKESNEDYAVWVLGLTYTVNNQVDKGIATFLSRKVPGAETNWALGYAYGLNGEREKAMISLKYNLERQKEKFVPAYLISIIYMGLEDYEKAIDWLEISHEEGPNKNYIFAMKVDPKLNPLEGHPRFEALLDKLPFERIRSTK